METISLLLLPVDNSARGIVTPQHVLLTIKASFKRKMQYQLEASLYYNFGETTYIGSQYIYCLGMYVSGAEPMCNVCLCTLSKQHHRRVCSRCNLVW